MCRLNWCFKCISELFCLWNTVLYVLCVLLISQTCWHGISSRIWVALIRIQADWERSAARFWIQFSTVGNNVYLCWVFWTKSCSTYLAVFMFASCRAYPCTDFHEATLGTMTKLQKVTVASSWPSVHLPLCLCEWNGSAATGRIFVKFYIQGFF